MRRVLPIAVGLALAVIASFAFWFVDRTLSSHRQSSTVSAGGEPLEPIQVEVIAPIVAAPNVPPPITRNYAARVIVELEVKEHVRTLAEGVEYIYWTFGDEAPGPFLRVREGDLVEVRLHNHPDNSVAHSIDFQAASGPSGGGEASFVAPGHSATFSWRATRAGLFVYDCKAAPPGVHTAQGMFGLILVEPREGLPPVDREFQIVQSEFYTKGAHGEVGPQPFAMEKATASQPEYVVFNGREGALAGARALRAHAGETVRIFFGNPGPNLTSSFHVSGEVFDRVYGEGGRLPNQRNVQTTVVPAGGSAIVDFTVEIPGKYTLMDHSMIRAFNKGTWGTLNVSGRGNQMLFSGRTSLAAYTPGNRLPAITGFDTGGKVDGAQLYASICVTCHQADGAGVPKAFPPLKESDFLAADRTRAIQIVMAGLQGEIVVNGDKFNGVMPNPKLNDEQIAAVLTHVLSNFGNQGDPVTPEEVAEVRKGFDPSAPLQADPAWIARK